MIDQSRGALRSGVDQLLRPFIAMLKNRTLFDRKASQCHLLTLAPITRACRAASSGGRGPARAPIQRIYYDILSILGIVPA
jgi:hypothetical protein